MVIGGYYMIKVMLIEDDPMVRDINTKFTNKIDNFSVLFSVDNIEEAKNIMLRDKVDLILLDIFLPKGNGLEFLKWLRNKELNCDVILITADKNSSAVKEAFRYGAVDYLVKPFTFERFKEALNSYKKRYESILSIEQVHQDTIDKIVLKGELNKDSAVKDETVLSKGLSRHTYEQILSALSDKSCDFTAEELAEDIGMARVTVRRYLEFMVNEDKLDVEMKYGKIGRPIHFYKVKN
jgi:response regulator of citrate/malate metabolism